MVAQDQAPITGQAQAAPAVPRSGLLLGVDRLPAAVDRGKATGSSTDDDGND